MYKAHTVSVGIEVPWRTVYDYAANPANLPKWALGFARAIEQIDGQWVAETTMGTAKVSFVPRNDHGVLDHTVEVPAGTFHNAMRVIPNADGAEVLFTALQFDGVSDAQFEVDLDTIRADLNKLRTLLEHHAHTPEDA